MSGEISLDVVWQKLPLSYLSSARFWTRLCSRGILLMQKRGNMYGIFNGYVAWLSFTFTSCILFCNVGCFGMSRGFISLIASCQVFLGCPALISCKYNIFYMYLYYDIFYWFHSHLSPPESFKPVLSYRKPHMPQLISILLWCVITATNLIPKGNTYIKHANTSAQVFLQSCSQNLVLHSTAMFYLLESYIVLLTNFFTCKLNIMYK